MGSEHASNDSKRQSGVARTRTCHTLPPSPGTASPTILALQASAGNRAVSTLVLRSKLASPAKPKGQAAPPAAERAISRADKIADLQGRAIVELKLASKRLRADADVYKKAYKDYYGTLLEADKVKARAEAASDLVLGIVIGAATGLVGPAALAARTALPLAGLILDAASWGAKPWVNRLGKGGLELLGNAVDEGFENASAALIGASFDESPAPSTSAALGGHDDGARFEKALHDLDELVSALPNLMPLMKAEHNLARLANSAAASGDADLAKLVALLDKASEIAVGVLTTMLPGPFQALVDAVNARPKRSQADVERMLWTEWAARLSSPYDELNYRVVRDRLETIGLGATLFQATTGPMTGPYAGEKIVDKSRRRINVNARAEWLASRGIELPGRSPWSRPMDTAVDMLFSAAHARESIEIALGSQRHGIYEGGGQGSYPDGRVTVGGKLYRVSGSIPPAAEAGKTKVIVDDVSPTIAYLRYLAKEYATEGMHSMNRIDGTDAGVVVRWDMYKGYPPFSYP